MAKVIAMYRMPADTAEFDRYYFTEHVPIARRLPGLRGYEVTRGPVAALDGTSPYYLVATLSFDSVAAIRAAIDSDAGRATAADLANFATGCVEIYYAETEAL